MTVRYCRTCLKPQDTCGHAGNYERRVVSAYENGQPCDRDQRRGELIGALHDGDRAVRVPGTDAPPHVHEPDIEKERIGDEWVFCRCGKRIFLKAGKWCDANMGGASSATTRIAAAEETPPT